MAEGAAGQIGNDVDSGFEVGDTESDIGIDFVQLNFGGAGANGDANRFFFQLCGYLGLLPCRSSIFLN
jgi:hypothetical protein